MCMCVCVCVQCVCGVCAHVRAQPFRNESTRRAELTHFSKHGLPLAPYESFRFFFYSSQLGDCILTPDSSQLGGNSSQLGEFPSQLGEMSSHLGEKSSQLGETVHLTINGTWYVTFQISSDLFEEIVFAKTHCLFTCIGQSGTTKMSVRTVISYYNSGGEGDFIPWRNVTN